MESQTLGHYLRVIYRKRMVIYVMTLAAIAMAAILSRTLTPMYEARATLFPPVAGDSLRLGTPLEVLPRGPQVPISTEDMLRGFFGILRSQRLAEIVAGKIPQRSLGDLRRNTRFSLTKYNLFEIRARDRDPRLAALVANTFAESFNELFEEISLPAARQTTSFIESQFAQSKEDLLVAEDRIKRFREQHETVSLPEETTELVKRMAQLRAQADSLHLELEEVRAKVASTENRLRTEAKMQLSSEVVTNNPVVEQLETKLAGLEVELAGARAKYTSIHPEVVRLQKAIAESKRQLSDEVKRIVSNQTTALNPVHEALRQNLVSLYIDERSLQRKIAEQATVIRKTEEQLLRLPRVAAQLAQLVRDARHLEETSNVLALKLEEARIQEKREIHSFVIVDRASVPLGPAYPNLLTNLIAAVGLSFLVGISYAFVLDYLDRRAGREQMGSMTPLMADKAGGGGLVGL